MLNNTYEKTFFFNNFDNLVIDWEKKLVVIFFGEEFSVIQFIFIW